MTTQPSYLALAEQYGPMALRFIAENGSLLVAHLPAIVSAAVAAEKVYVAIKTSPHAGTVALMTFVTQAVTNAPELVALFPSIISQVQANADAAIRLQSSVG